MRFLNPVQMAHSLVSERLAVGDVAIDATAGNGHDTAFLARLVGGSGRVYAFDVQQEALESTRTKLVDEELDSNVRLIQDDHAKMADHLDGGDFGGVGAVMFNLGYLPGGDKEVITTPSSSLDAVRAALDVIRPGGIVTVVAYVGHPGGQAEAEALEELIGAELPSGMEAIRYAPLARRGAPYLLSVRRSEGR